MKLYNSKSLKLEEFKSIKPNEVSMYVCGPTVYNHAHIGNARPIIVFDTLRRFFEAEGYKVKFVSNYTDVDDKIIKKALEENISEADVSLRYIQAYEKVREELNTLELDAKPKVTDTIDEIIEFIDKMVKSGNAYEVDGDVYFRVNSIEDYGSISNQSLDDLQAGARIEENDKKESPFDFTLWKKTKEGIMWDSPWGKGRPGWHTECVVMIEDNFDGMIDIHGGGVDLKFPHHENEAAQNMAVNHNHIANYWIHNAMINIDGNKMSKSLGNVTWAIDVINKLGSNLTRWFILSVHYRKELNFTDEAIETAKKELDKILLALKNARIKLSLNNVSLTNEKDEESYKNFLNELSDDLNTPNAYSVIYDTVKKLNNSTRLKELDYNTIGKLINSIESMLYVLGIRYNKYDLSIEEKELFNKWNQAKSNKDFETADKYREKLIEKELI
ncbi:MAG: cysteine--tRNA ligase [Erysipelotrichaceae bacterium]|nr:cysteine--tRNA ligase [Erysipelotrichaceae bacterium]